VRVLSGEEFCPPAGIDERATLDRIGAPPDVRLACQLRPQGDISVVPLVSTARPIYRQTAPQLISAERKIVVLFCDFRNRADLTADHLPQDLLYILTLYVEGVGNAIRAAGGTLSTVATDSICALFGLDGNHERAAQGALRAAGAIEAVISDLNNRLGRQSGGGIKIAVSIHAGRAAVGEIGSSDPPTVMAVGEAIDAANDLRKAAAEHDKPFAISEPVHAAAGLDPVVQDTATIRLAGFDAFITAYLSDAAPVPSPSWTLHGKQGRGAKLRRLLAG
jgi:adenylate cyclase